MIGLVALLLGAAGLAVLAVAIIFAIEIAASFFYQPPQAPAARSRGRIVVVIPAHNEDVGIGATIAAARAGLSHDDAVLVVADNCTDATAATARALGADVIERHDNERRGKGFALQFGIDHLRRAPPEAIVFIDADCAPVAGSIERVARLAVQHRRPVQALYLMRPPAGAGAAARVSAFAWLVINRVRMNGLQALAGFSRLTGSGMALPWALVEGLDLATGEIVEDLALTIALVEAGAAPILDVAALVESDLAPSAAGAATQRARWEFGSMRLARARIGALAARGIGGDWKSLAMALDLLIPPLTVLGGSILAGALVAVPIAFAGHPAPLSLFSNAGIVFAGALAAAWFAYGRKTLPPETLAGIGGYLIGKLRVYGGEGRRSAKGWTRTDRGKD